MTFHLLELLGSLVVGAVVFLVPAALLRSARKSAGLALAFVALGAVLTVTELKLSAQSSKDIQKAPSASGS